jgi:hypothetical protein
VGVDCEYAGMGVLSGLGVFAGGVGVCVGFGVGVEGFEGGLTVGEGV